MAIKTRKYIFVKTKQKLTKQKFTKKKITDNNNKSTEYINEIRKDLNKYLDDVYSKIHFDKNNFNNLINKITSSNIRKKDQYKTNLCIINIELINNKCLFNIVNKKDLPKDTRTSSILQMMINFSKWFSRTHSSNSKINIKTTLLIWISDRFIWDIENIDHKIPICLYACPSTMNYLIIPDSTFIALSEEKRYGSVGLDWEQQKKLFSNLKNIDSKENTIFFRGADTTDLNHNLRRVIYDRLQTEKDKEFKKVMKYEFLTSANYQSVKEVAKYKWLLNLPGRYPWSTRLKYLYLARSYIINVKVDTTGDVPSMEPNYLSFVDLFVPDKYMFNIDMNYHYYDYKNENKDKENKYNKKNLEETNRVYDEIKTIYYKTKEKSPKEDKNVLEANKIINSFTTDHIYEYYFEIMKRNAAMGIKPYLL